MLRQPHEMALPAAALSDVDYDRILVPVVGTRLSDEMMVLGCQLATEKNAVIDLVYVVEVPMQMPLDATLPNKRQRGRHVLDAAMAVAREFGVEAWPHLVSARTPGRAIVDAAEEWDSDVVILGAVRTQRAGRSPGRRHRRLRLAPRPGRSTAQPRPRRLSDAGVGGRLRRTSHRRDAVEEARDGRRREEVTQEMYVIIAGCGRVGSTMAMQLAAEGHDVVVIDEDPGAFTLLERRLPRAAARGSGHRLGHPA